MTARQPFTLRWGIIATGFISQEFVKVRTISSHGNHAHTYLYTGRVNGSQDVCSYESLVTGKILISHHSRDVHDVMHKVVAVGSRSVESAQKFIQEYANGDNSIKAYSTYQEVYSDPVSRQTRYTSFQVLIAS
jgi:predicted dehydrogenase